MSVCFNHSYMLIPWTARKSNPSVLKEINPEYHWKDWCWSSSTSATWCKELTPWKRPRCWERLGAAGEEGDRGWDGGWHHWLNGHEFAQTLGDGEGQGNLAGCSPWDHKESDTTERLNWTSTWKILCIISHQGSADQNHNEIPLHTY